MTVMAGISLKRRSTVGYVFLTAAAMTLIGFGVAYVYMPSSATASVLRTSVVTRGNVQTTETATGNISSASSVTVGFPISGTLTQINVSLGSKVQAGEVLGKIDPSSAEIALTAAQAALASAEENLTTAKEGGSAASKTSDQSNLENAESTLADDEQQLTTDNTDLATAKHQLNTDKNLGCPAAGSSTVTSAISGNTSSSSSSSASSFSQGSTNSGAGSSSVSSSATLHSSVIRQDSASHQIVMNEIKAVFYLPDYLDRYLERSFANEIPDTFSSSVGPGPLLVTNTSPNSTPTQSTGTSDTVSTTTSTTSTTTTLAPTAPGVLTGNATNLMTDQATLNGTVSPDGASTSYYFAWGPNSKLANHTPVQTLTATTGTLNVSADITGLKVDTNYLFRLIATNSVRVSKGLSQLFTTAESSCTEEESVITEDESAIAKQKVTIQQAKTNLAATEASITQSNQNNNVSVSSDEATVAQDQANVAADEKDLQETTLTAPIAGTITSLNYSLGESVSPYSSASSSSSNSTVGNSGRAGIGTSSSSSSSSSAGFATITNLNNFEVTASIAEADISQIALGQQATITLPALPSVTVTGKVTYISDISTVSSNVVTYDVTIKVVNPPSSLKDGMTADISILTGSADNVLAVPSAAITTNGSVSTVTTYINGVRHTQVVKVGLIGSSTTQILSGLSLGQTVILPSVTVSPTVGSPTSSATTGGGIARFGGGGFGGGGFGG